MRQLINPRSRVIKQLRLNNGIQEVRASSFKRVRGATLIGAIGDESAFWSTDEGSANPDSAICNALRPSLATTGGMLALISSPYSKRGELYNLWKRHFGAHGDPRIVVAQAASRTMNPSLSQSVVDRALERDRASASAEYLAQFRSDIGALVDRKIVDSCIMRGRPSRCSRAIAISPAAFIRWCQRPISLRPRW
jgi:hypothetical protein